MDLRALNEDTGVPETETTDSAEASLLEEQVKILGAQMDAFREQSMKGINTMAAAMKMLLPQKPAGTAN